MKTNSGIAQAGADSEIEAAGSQGTLRGTLHRSARGNGPIALIIPGSGPTDRDGNSPLGIEAGSYRLLAEALGARGVSTVRIDKRGMFASEAACGAECVTLDDYVDDVNRWVGVLKTKFGAPCIWLIGHSEGGLVAIAAARQQSDVCGLVLLATAGRTGGDLLREQLRRNPANAEILPSALAAIDTLEAGRHVDVEKLDPNLANLFRPSVQDFLISLFSYDPVSLLQGYRRATLIVQGQRDVQIGERDARLLHSALPAATLLLLPTLNHVLKDVDSDELQQNVAAYADPGLPLGRGLAPGIAAFLMRHDLSLPHL